MHHAHLWHIRCVNSRALEIAGITRDTPDPVGGEIERDATGEPTGVLKETARDLVTPFIPKPSEHDAVQHIVDLGRLLASQASSPRPTCAASTAPTPIRCS